LTLCLNTVPFSDNNYGIESAAMKFFNKHTKDLTVEESAVFGGSLKANHSCNPRIFPERSWLRSEVVFQQMEKYGFLTNEEMLATS
jgi:penicillin-binding protein 1A